MKIQIQIGDLKLSTEDMVYCIDGDTILCHSPYAFAEECFFVEPFGTLKDRKQWFYEDYGETWFTDLNKAKKKYKENCKNSSAYNLAVLIERTVNETLKEVAEFIKGRAHYLCDCNGKSHTVIYPEDVNDTVESFLGNETIDE